MAELIEVNVANLSGEALGWAVGKAEGLDVLLAPPVYGNPWRVFVRYAGEVTTRDVRYVPQDSWADGGPLIDKYQITITYHNAPDRTPLATTSGMHPAFQAGETILVAACRAIVAAKLGDTVQVPKELI